MYELLSRELLPEWFEYPKNLLCLLEDDEIDFGPWQLLHGKWLNVRHAGLKERYPNLDLVPFARRLDDDDVACFDVSENSSILKVKIIHDFASSGWEEREELESFDIWLQEAKELAKDWD
ncbi:hypothetical protein C7H09_12405 [Marinobacter fuscus]|uniref:SMI1/KNR4 family protein n=1 Tax=Marinobacter fuscus TaxID=2109942 RepID=A0A2T1K743_9GAMM|nr:hypothetical protein [Marinobacter fuscus]PSF05917.1 hypothetical protein C7H09_12405 [Marinobacter fuscus]